MKTKLSSLGWVQLSALVGLAGLAAGQIHLRSDPHLVTSRLLVPQARPWAHPPAGAGVQISGIDAGIEIMDQVATTTLDISLTNAGAARLEAEVLVPVPEGAALRGFQFQGAAMEPTAQLLPKDEARRLYEAIVAKVRDPALLEFAGFNAIRTSVFPVEARSGQRVRIIYEQLLPCVDGVRVDYVLPRSEQLDYLTPWNVRMSIRSTHPISTVYSPSHPVATRRITERRVGVKWVSEGGLQPGPFRLSYLREQGGITASLLAYPDPALGGGYFLLLGGTPARDGSEGRPAVMKREVILVLDRSGSMAGEKLDQARAAALQVLEALEPGEAFNIIVFHEAVESFAQGPVIKTPETLRAARQFVRGIRARGGTNIRDALVEALRSKPRPGMLPIVLFLTDGLPTVGLTSEKSIREVATQGNPHLRRIFTFGVGVDVNTPLLDKIARETRAVASFVLPHEDVEVKVSEAFKRLSGPVLAGPSLRTVASEAPSGHARVRELLPAQLPDLFEGDQFVVLGQYVGSDPITFELEGDYLGKEKRFTFTFALDKSTTRNSFVPRLWASRKIARLTDAIRELGADSAAMNAANPAHDPRLQELVGEIVGLSKEFGILTEYTAFFAREGTDLAKPAHLLAETTKNYQEKAVAKRSGYDSVNQEFNNSYQRGQSCLNLRNEFIDDTLKRVSIATVQQINDRAFYKRGARWVDSSMLEHTETPPQRVVTIGSEEFLSLARRLAQQGRAGCLALHGEILLNLDGQTILVR